LIGGDAGSNKVVAKPNTGGAIRAAALIRLSIEIPSHLSLSAIEAGHVG
jgi:hypothetical protein